MALGVFCFTRNTFSLADAGAPEWTKDSGPPHFRWTTQTRGTLRSDAGNYYSENLATHLSQVEASVYFQGISEMLPNAKTCHPCARTLVSPMWSVWTQRAQRNSAARCAVREMTVQMGTVRRGHRSDWGYICAVPEHIKQSRDPKIHLKGTVL